VPHRVFELKEKWPFLHESNNNDDANCYNEDFIQKLGYMVDISEGLSQVNKTI
jgi:hypothetical protein